MHQITDYASVLPTTVRRPETPPFAVFHAGTFALTSGDGEQQDDEDSTGIHVDVSFASFRLFSSQFSRLRALLADLLNFVSLSLSP